MKKLVEYKNKGKFEDDFILGNQWIPLMRKTTMQEKIHLGAKLDSKADGGQISHINIQSRFPNFESAWELTKHIAREGVIYFAYNTKINVCEDEHAFMGTHCRCGKIAKDVFSRIVGFLTPRSSYTVNRKKEFDARLYYDVA